MNLNKELQILKNNTENVKVQQQFNEIKTKLEQSVKEGYVGAVFGFHISTLLGETLTKEGLNWTTFTDGEFEESSIWIN